MHIIKNVIAVLAIAVLLCSCNSRMSYQEEIAKSFENGTDSTYERIYVKNKGGSYFYTSKARNRIPYGTKTSFGKIKIETKFIYDYDEESRRHLREIYSVFTVGNVSNTYGHYFDFEKGEYAWLCNENGTSSYICNMDSFGNITKETGTIQVDGFKDIRYKKRDVLFTTVFHDIDSVVISSSKTKPEKYEIKPYSWQPMMNYVLLDYSIDSIFYIETYATRRKDKVRQVYTDTFYVK